MKWKFQNQFHDLLKFNFEILKSDWLKRKKWAQPGFEPGTTRTQSEYHTPRPLSRQNYFSNIKIQISTVPILKEVNKLKALKTLYTVRVVSGQKIFQSTFVPFYFLNSKIQNSKNLKLLLYFEKILDFVFLKYETTKF